MSLANGDLSAADVAAVVGNNNGNGGWGLGNDGSFWIIILFLFALMGGNFGWGGNNGGGGNQYVTQADMQRGFDQTATMNAIGNLNNSVQNGFSSAEIASCDRLANLTAQMNNLAMNQQNCCCENKQLIGDLKYTIATEGANTRAAVTDGTRQQMDNCNRNYQAIMDKLCQLELDAKNDKIASLQAQVNNLQFNASQIAQNGYFQNAINNAVSQLQPTPKPSYIVPNPYESYGAPYAGGCGCGSMA